MPPITEKRTQIYLSATQHRAAVELARRRGVSLAAVVREALERYLESDAQAEEVDWSDDPALALVGALSLPPLHEGEDLSDAIDRSAYDE
jgi:hypothetical protein